ncbi:hypothetical protein E2562_022349 [Oryza meyeriana var. granulata]|uniref:Uncharacterized protein n=1 Tax=Oryza meyeriana var. granulata TaxID=110450 RepID=A0A6G1DLU3_9ORYZ|nr:hypothetical protein E2562_022349 [Oryza meyeriana var. granulata]
MMLVDKGSMDLVLVPCGLAIMLGYHLILLHRILRHPHTTVIGYENHNKLAWVERMMVQTAGPEESALALGVISDNISAATTLASVCIALGSLIGTWVSSSSVPGAGAGIVVFYGDGSHATATVKCVVLLACFLASFTCFIQSARYYVHASFLMSALGSDVPVDYVQRAVVRGGNFWAAGLRALYLATALLMWVFGPVPMLACSVLTVAVLHRLDANSMPLHHHRFTARDKEAAATALRPVAAARSALARGGRAGHGNTVIFSPASLVS